MKMDYITGGTMLPQMASYVERAADTTLRQRLLQGDLCYILTPRQMGKSSLMAQTAFLLRQAGVACAVVDITRLDCHSAPVWYRDFLEKLGESLGIEAEMEAFLQQEEERTPLSLLMHALQHVVLKHVSGQVVIFLDEIDYTRSMSFPMDDFFAAIRALHNARAYDPACRRLGFCLLGVASPSDLIKNPEITPFNVGVRIDLLDFTFGEAEFLGGGLGHDAAANQKLIRRIYDWTGGHPYLTQRLCHTTANDQFVQSPSDIDVLCRRLFFTSELTPDVNIQDVRVRLLAGEEAERHALLKVYQRVFRGGKVADSDTAPLVARLRLTGAVRAEAGLLKVRNRIYSTVFNQDWLNAHLPGRAEQIRRRREQWKGALTVGIPGAAALLVIAGLACSNWLAFRREQHLVYSHDMTLISEKWLNNEVEPIPALLQSVRDSPYRGTEWDFWNQRCNSAAVVLTAHHDNVNALAFSPDGRFFATAGDDGIICYWDAMRSHLVKQWNTSQEHVYDIAFSPDGRSLLAGGHKQGAIVWDVLQAKVVTRLPMQNDKAIGSVAYSLAGDLMATTSDDGSAAVWQAGTAQKLYALPKLTIPPQHAVAAFSPDGRRLLLCTPKQGLLCDARTGKALFRPLTQSAFIQAGAFSRDGHTVVLGCAEGTIGVWNADTGIKRFDLHNPAGVNCLAFTNSGTGVFAGGGDGVTRLWSLDAATREPMQALAEHTGAALGIAVSPDGTRLVSGGEDRTVRLWTLNPAPSPLRLHCTAQINALAYTPDGQSLVTAQGEFTPNGKPLACLWDLTSGKQTRAFRGHAQAILCAGIDASGQRLVTGDKAGEARLWNLNTGECVFVTSPAAREIKSVAFDPRGANRFVTAWHQGFTLWDAGGSKLNEVRHNEGVTTSTLAWQGNRFLTAGGENTFRLWDSDAFERHQAGRILLHEYGRHGPNVEGKARLWPAVFSPDGKTIATGGTDKVVRIWDAASGTLLHTLAGHTKSVHCIAFSHDGRRLLTGSEDTTVRLWDMDTESELFMLHSHQDEVTAVAFAPDDGSLASASKEGDVFIWRLKNRLPVLHSLNTTLSSRSMPPMP